MYPSKTDGLFGVFVKNMRQEFENQGVRFTKTALIEGKSNSTLKKLLRYIKHYASIFSQFCFRKSNYDLIYVHYITHHIPILLLLLPFKRKPWVINVHGDDIIGLMKQPKLDYFSRLILKKTDLLVVPSPYFKIVAKNHYSFLQDDSIYVSPSGGIDPVQFYKKNNLKNNEILTLGFVSRFIEEKGWKTFLDALIKLKENNIAFKATIAGKGPDEDKIKAYLKKHNLSQVNFLGFVNQKKLVHLYNQFDLYVFPTYREGESLGLTGVEAMSCGTPVVACNMAGPSTYIKHQVNGYLFKPKDANMLFEQIKSYYLLDKNSQKKLSNAAYQTSREYDKTFVAKSLIKKLKNYS